MKKSVIVEGVLVEYSTIKGIEEAVHNYRGLVEFNHPFFNKIEKSEHLFSALSQPSLGMVFNVFISKDNPSNFIIQGTLSLGNKKAKLAFMFVCFIALFCYKIFLLIKIININL